MLKPNSLEIAISDGQIPVTAEKIKPVAGRYSSQFALEKPVRKIPVHKMMPTSANQIRVGVELFMIIFLNS
jgi:hypothetical protein